MSTYSVYNIKVDNDLSFTPGPTAGFVLTIGSDGHTYWSQGGSGSAGSSGSSGSSGQNGSSGSSGVSGSSGSSGTSGTSGVSGTSGTSGSSGTSAALSVAVQYTSAVGLTGSSTGVLTGLTFSYDVNGLYEINIPFLYQVSNANADAAFSYILTQPIVRYFIAFQPISYLSGGLETVNGSTRNTGATNSQIITYTANMAPAINTPYVGQASGIFQAGLTAGVAELRWHQDAANAILLTGSTMIVRKLN